MRRIKLLAAFVAILAVMVFGVGAAYAWGWYWNSAVDLEGTSVRTAWTVIDGDPDDYYTDIQVWVPRGAEADIVELAEGHERVSIRTRRGLSCDSDSVETLVAYKVRPANRDADRKASVEVDITADGESIGTAEGRVGERITVMVDVPASDPGCSDRGDEDGNHDD